jgi:hypothetical protein
MTPLVGNPAPDPLEPENIQNHILRWRHIPVPTFNPFGHLDLPCLWLNE